MPVPPLTTTPNAGLPVGFRKQLHPNGDERLSAAGIMFVTPDGRALFVKRMPPGDHAGTWAFPAGKVEQDEEPADAARREALEEVGHLAAWDLAPINRETADGVDFCTFGQPVPDEFDPVLNEEHNEHVWADLRHPPQPLHPGVARTLERFFAEEADEPEHESGSAHELERVFATDAPSLTQEAAGYTDGPVDKEPCEACTMWRNGRCSLVIGKIKPRGHCYHWSARKQAADSMALDRASVRSFDEDGRMRIAVTNISKANICPYSGKEVPGWDEEKQEHVLGLDPDKIYMMLRDPDELARSLKTWNGIQLLKAHKPVDADDHQMWDIVGTTGTNAEFSAPYLRNSLVIWTKEGIDLIESGDQKELSCGYHYDPDMTPGVFAGERYDGVMRNIRGNHVALVEEGRAGPDVLVADTLVNLQWDVLIDAMLGLRAA